MIQIGIANKSHREKWNKFILKFDNATFFHQFDWRQVIKSTYGHTSYYLYAMNENEIIGVFPLFFINGRIFGKFFVSLPYCDYGGPLSKDPDIIKQLINSSFDICKEKDADFIEIRTDHIYNITNLHVRNDKANLILKLSEDWQVLWNGLKPKVRNQIRKAQTSGLEIKTDSSLKGLKDFYKVFSANMRDLGTPTHSIELFKNILTIFPDNSKLVHVLLDQQVIASGLIISYNDYVEVPFASSYKAYRSFCPNNLLYWSVLKMACQRGAKTFLFGRSTWNSGTFNFKKQWGSVPHQLHYQYYLNKIDKLPEMNPDNKKYQLAIALWKKLPVHLTRVIGPKIIRNIL